ncbi:MAG: FMN-binding negative transcriptional regulator [Marinobacter sp.]
MYVPNSFKENDAPRLRQYIRDYGFGLLVIADGQGIEAARFPSTLSAIMTIHSAYYTSSGFEQQAFICDLT